MSPRGAARLWMAQRATAVILAFCVVVHLATIILAVRAISKARRIVAIACGYSERM